jgi:DNA polymerase-3 subunit epsilon
MLSDTPLAEGAFVAVDIETTGCTPGRNGIIELGAVRIEDGRIVGTFSELVNPGECIPYSVQMLTRITEAMVADAPPIAEVFTRFREFAHGAVLVAHNYRFDLGFLDWLSESTSGEPFPRPVLDTLAIARRLHPQLGKYNLGLLAGMYGVPTRPNHRADTDARATAEVFIQMCELLAAEGLRTAGDLARYCGMAGQQDLARKLVMTTGLPDQAGVYLLRDARGAVIYVGRAKNLRLRLRSYFYVNYEASGPRLGEETTSVRHISCPSNLDAVLLQSRLVGRYHPRHNVTGERGEFAALLHVDTSSSFPALKVTGRPGKRGITVGPFVSRWAVESLAEQLREVYGLRRCVGRITKRTGEVACAFRDTGECPSPCVGGIDPDEYKHRLTAALSVFDGSAEGLRTELEARHEAAARVHDHDTAIRYRDALRALDRALSGLRVVRSSTSRFGTVIVEVGDGRLSLHMMRYGYLVRTLRVAREGFSAAECEGRIRRAVHRAYFSGPYVDDPFEFSSQQLKDVFLVSSYRHQHSPVELDVRDTEDETVTLLMSAVRRSLRVPRKRHAAPSVAGGSRRP